MSFIRIDFQLYKMKKTLLFLFIAFIGLPVFSQSANPVKWTYSAKKIADKTYEVHVTASVDNPWHIYSQNIEADLPVATAFTFTKNPLVVIHGKVNEVGKLIKKKEEVLGGVLNYYEKSVDFVQKIKLKGNTKTNLAGKVEYVVCNDGRCLPPAEANFSVNIGG